MRWAILGALALMACAGQVDEPQDSGEGGTGGSGGDVAVDGGGGAGGDGGRAPCSASACEVPNACGESVDDCGQPIDCGGCHISQACVGGACACKPATDEVRDYICDTEDALEWCGGPCDQAFYCGDPPTTVAPPGCSPIELLGTQMVWCCITRG